MVAAATPAVAVTEVVVVVFVRNSLTSHHATLHPRLKNIAPK